MTPTAVDRGVTLEPLQVFFARDHRLERIDHLTGGFDRVADRFVQAARPYA